MKSSYHCAILMLAIEIVSAIVVLRWDCSILPDVCQNMCWGVKCSGQHGTLEKLTWDKAGKKIKNRRRTAAGCAPHPNRCSVKAKPPNDPHVPGYNCDEFPFASTAEADNGSQWSRCVPISQNDLQGVILSKFLSSKNGCNKMKGCEFIMAFDKVPSDSHFCNATPTNWATECNNTARGANGELEVINGNNAMNPPHWKVRDSIINNVYTFRLKNSGDKITTSTNLAIGTKVLSIAPKIAANNVHLQTWANMTENASNNKAWWSGYGWNEDVDEVAELVDPFSIVDPLLGIGEGEGSNN